MTVFDRNRPAGVVIHMHVLLLAVELVDDVIAGSGLVRVIHSVTALFRRRVRIPLLHLLFDLVAGEATGSRARDRGEHFAIPATDAITQQAADDCANTGSGQARLVLRGL